MELKGSLLLKDHLNAVARSQLSIWREKALQQRQHHAMLNEMAVKHDKTVLLTISLANWQRLWLEHRQVRDTKRFYGHLERRAVKARDMYLQVKYLQQWSDAARRHVSRTSFARQHMVKYRCFNAWAEVTAVNAFKVRRQVLSKFFGAWKQRYANVSAADNYALQRYEDNLVEKTYWQWIRKKMDAKATAWWAEGAKRRSLFNMIAGYHIAWENHRTADEARRHRLVWNAWRIWRNKTHERARQKEQATEYYDTRICRKAFTKWSGETRVIPARNVVQADVKQRMLREAFDTWLHRTRQERQAAEVDRAKILREAVTTWRFQYRSQRLRAKIDARIKAETLYKLMVAEEAAILERRGRERWLRRIMTTWMENARRIRDRRLQLENIAQSHLVNKSQKATLAQWLEQTHIQREQESKALTLYQPRLLQKAVMQWSERAEHVQKLEGWSRDAEFYFLTTKSIKRWKASTEASKREKRKAAYTQVRRTVKVNLATGILRNWHQQAQYVLNLQDQAQNVRQNKDVVIGMEIFDQWRARAAELAELEAVWRGIVLKKHLSIWKGRSSAYQALETEAILTYEEKRESRAFKKWHVTALQLRSQTNYAYDIREKNAKRTFRKMFTYWHQKALVKRPRKIPEPEEPLVEFGATERAEIWSEYGDGPESDEMANGQNEIVPSTAIPGYLSTPSKRSERVMAVAARFSTTPKAPLSTPFERQLRAQYSGGQLHSFRKGAARSTLSMGRGFDDIEEKRHE
jgi:protein SFI1